jgi:hypothetical protein
LTALLLRSIEALQPTTVKVFEDIAVYTAPHANLVYYRDLAEIVEGGCASCTRGIHGCGNWRSA